MTKDELIRGLSAKIVEVLDREEKLKNAVRSLKSNLASVDEWLEIERSQFRDYIKSVNQAMDRRDLREGELLDKTEECSEIIAGLQNEKFKLESEKCELEKAIEVSVATVKSHVSHINDLELSLRGLVKKNESLKSEISSVKSEYVQQAIALRKEVGELKANLARVKDDNVDLLLRVERADLLEERAMVEAKARARAIQELETLTKEYNFQVESNRALAKFIKENVKSSRK